MSYNTVVNHFTAEFPNITKSQKKIFGYLIFLRNKYGHVFPKQANMAGKKRISISTVERAIRKFLELGWIKVIRPNRRERNYYLIGQWIADAYNRMMSDDKRRTKESYQPKISRENDGSKVHSYVKMKGQNNENEGSKTPIFSRENEGSDRESCIVKPSMGGAVHNFSSKPKGSQGKVRERIGDYTEEEKEGIGKGLCMICDDQSDHGRFNYEPEEMKYLFGWSERIFGARTPYGNLLKEVEGSLKEVRNYPGQVRDKISLAIYKMQARKGLHINP